MGYQEFYEDTLPTEERLEQPVLESDDDLHRLIECFSAKNCREYVASLPVDEVKDLLVTLDVVRHACINRLELEFNAQEPHHEQTTTQRTASRSTLRVVPPRNATARRQQPSQPSPQPAQTQSDEPKERQLDVHETAKIIGYSEKWIYTNAKNLPFAWKLPNGQWRFSAQGVQEWLDKMRAQSSGRQQD